MAFISTRVQNAALGCNLKNDRTISVHFQGNTFNITVIQVYAPTTNAEEAEGLPWKPTRFSRNNNNKRCPFHHKGLNTKVQSQEIPKVTGKFGLGVQNEVGQRLTEFCQKNVLVIANTLFQQHKRQLNTWTSLDGQYQIQTDYILCSQRWRSSIQSAKTRLGADCGSDHTLLIAKFRFKLKKVGKTTRPLRPKSNPLRLYSGSDK